jgi:TnpA family transposase
LATRELLSNLQRIQFTQIPLDISARDIARYYTFNSEDLKFINSRRRVHNRLGFAVQLCYLRFPSRVWEIGEQVPKPILSYIALQLSIKSKFFKDYAVRDTTRREHLAEIQKAFGYESMSMSHYKRLSKWLIKLAFSTDKGIALVEALVEEMRQSKIIIPAISTVERLAWETRRRAQNQFYVSLTKHLTTIQKKELDGLLVLNLEKNRTPLVWLRQPPGVANPKNFLKILEKFEFIRDLNLDSSCLTKVHHNRLVQLTRIGVKTTPAHIARLDDLRRYATDRDATHVVDGLMYHETDLKIEEHFTDTNGFTDHVFGICHILGFRFCPRMRDLSSKKLHVFDGVDKNSPLSPLLGEKINVKLIAACWDDILRLATSVSKGTVTASLMMRKLAAYPRQNKLAIALREVGRIERTLFTLYWLQSPQLRRKATSELNKGELKNSLSRAIFFHRLGEVRDRSFEDQSLRASGLNLAVAAIVLWNTVYLENAVNLLKSEGVIIPDEYLQHLSPMGWEHINLTGDYIWNLKSVSSIDNLRPLIRKKSNFQ